MESIADAVVFKHVNLLKEELAELFDVLHDKIAAMEKESAKLKEQVNVLRYQLQDANQRVSNLMDSSKINVIPEEW